SGRRGLDPCRGRSLQPGSEESPVCRRPALQPQPVRCQPGRGCLRAPAPIGGRDREPLRRADHGGGDHDAALDGITVAGWTARMTALPTTPMPRSLLAWSALGLALVGAVATVI